MGKADPDATKSGRRRQLNVIYFIDSARTRSFSLSLGQLNVLLLLFFGTIVWSVASVGLIVWLADGQGQLAGQLRTALTTVFEYETRYEGAYEVAYPTGDKTSRPTMASAPSEAKAVDVQARPTAPAESTGAITGTAPPEDEAADTSQPVADVEESSPSSAAPPVQPAVSGDPVPSEELAVAVGNPVLEASGNALELRFDLTSKASQDRAEGYVWAVAEFTADDGQKMYIGAPSSIQVKADGEPTYPQRSAIFGIKRFKKKIFSFPLIKEKAGTFTGVRIGVMDRNGTNKTTYNVPVQIRVGKGTSSSPESDVVDGKSG